MKQIELYLYAIIILLFLLYENNNSKKQRFRESNHYKNIIVSTIVIQIIECIAWGIDGRSGFLIYELNYFFSSLIFAFNLVPICLWLVYLDECILRDEIEKKRKKIVYIGSNLIAIFLVLINLFTNIIFTITPENLYVRQKGSFILMFLNYALYFGYLFSLRKYKKSLNGRIYKLILALGVFPLVGAILQMTWYGLTFIWPMMTLVTLAAYMLIERDEIKRDLLTGLYTRTHLENRIMYKIREKQPFTIIMIDLDKFKSINDTFGHEEGDQALRIVANLLEKSIKIEDSAYRFGGDEFILLIETENLNTAKLVEKRINRNLKKINDASDKPYMILLSTGASFYDGVKNESLNTLLAKADENMYINKRSKGN